MAIAYTLIDLAMTGKVDQQAWLKWVLGKLTCCNATRLDGMTLRGDWDHRHPTAAPGRTGLTSDQTAEKTGNSRSAQKARPG